MATLKKKNAIGAIEQVVHLLSASLAPNLQLKTFFLRTI